jgi:CDP-diglyceride synthetase
MNIKRAKLVSEYRLAPKLAVPLQTILLLAAVVFVASFTHEVLDTNNLYVNQHFLLTILQLLLTLWAFIEVKSVASKITYTPLKSLETVLVVQFIVLLIRGFTGDGGFMEPSREPLKNPLKSVKFSN